MELGEYIYRDIEKNGYLIKLYTDLIKLYTMDLFGINYEKDNICKKDLLRFADLLSKSTNINKKQIHNNIAQNIVVLLDVLFKDDTSVKVVKSSVLQNINNYKALDENSLYYNVDIREFITKEMEKQLYNIQINGEDIYFVRDQREIFNTISKQKIYSFSGPTSVGKTFVIETFVLNEIQKGKKNNFVIVVPTKALISEIYSEFINKLKGKLEEKRYKVITTPKQISDKENCNYIMIYTQERLLNHLLERNIKLDYVFIDEAHKIFENDYRNIYFYKIIDLLMENANVPNIVFSSPLIENPEELIKLLPNTLTSAIGNFKFSPVNQEKFIINYKDKNIRIYNDLTKNFIELQYNRIDKYDINLILNILGKNKKNIVYCESRKEAIDLAIEYAKTKKNIIENESIKKLKQYMKNEVHKDYYLIDLISKGVAYHIGYIPSNIRKIIEDLYKDRNSHIDTIFCTRTLLEGVNLPADNLFISLKDNTRLLKNELDFKNLIGRVGRIKYNLLGNVFIIPRGSDNEKVLMQCREIIEKPVPVKQLEIKSMLTKQKKKKILENLENNEPFIEKTKAISYSEYNSYNFIINNLIEEIINNDEGNFVKEFNDVLMDEKKDRIKTIYENRKSLISVDIPISINWVQKLDYDILYNNLQYPTQMDYHNIYEFLCMLYKKFNWKDCEPKTGLGNFNKLKYYAVILQQWMKGMSISQIIYYTIKRIQENGQIWDNVEHQMKDYKETLDQNNEIINDVLDNIENIVLFKIANYFSKFSERYKVTKDIDAILDDWYEYIQYGTDNKGGILLQQLGFSREIALKIHKKGYYKIQEETKKIIVLSNIFEDKDTSIIEEAIEVKYNFKEAFEE